VRRFDMLVSNMTTRWRERAGCGARQAGTSKNLSHLRVWYQRAQGITRLGFPRSWFS